MNKQTCHFPKVRPCWLHFRSLPLNINDRREFSKKEISRIHQVELRCNSDTSLSHKHNVLLPYSITDLIHSPFCYKRKPCKQNISTFSDSHPSQFCVCHYFHFRTPLAFDAFPRQQYPSTVSALSFNLSADISLFDILHIL